MSKSNTKLPYTATGLKQTKQRDMVYKLLEKQSKPLSAEQICHRLNEDQQEINTSTVYRILKSFTDKELVNKNDRLLDTKTVYTLTRHRHRHYLICLGCQQMIPIAHCPIKALEVSLKKQTDFQITGHQLAIYGYCPECQSSEKEFL